ncbi:probable serine/threonine-protein kinase PBL28 isoform X2 [Primulina huaijiensis]|uniref:probable serine/threonine-protein kinase PBL28 isoform X2 n=1 Tax=Primulina huaijiensis TaxID=1492673 RepID=UPI003CC76934
MSLIGLVSAWNKRRRSKSEDQINSCIYKPLEYWKNECGNPPAKRRNASSVFTFREMAEATCSFSDENLLGKGGFGRVYKGTLRSGEVVAIKKMELPWFKEAEGEREFRVEVDILSGLDHPNLVTLIGYCADGKHRFLVYEYMNKGNLQDHLNGIGEVKMDWSVRLKVAIGAARGLAYLHSSSAVGIPIVHRDFKSTNILLDSNYEAKISDFGLAKLMPEGQETCVTARVLGTFGYFDPEYTLVRHILNDKKKLKKVIDQELERGSYTMESIAMFVNLALRCVRLDSRERPSMSECVKELQVIRYTNSKGLGMTMHTLRMI